MYLIIGLGNPGERYKLNRHNVGFLFLDYLLYKNSLNSFKKKKNFYYSLNEFENTNIIMIKPNTYMNLSGIAVVSSMAFFKIKLKNIIIIYDDIALDFGNIRIREKGTDGGHNGIKNIQEQLGTIEYNRVRIGVGSPQYPGEMINHVLSDFTEENLKILNNDVFNKVEDSIKLIINNKIKEAMNKYNGINNRKSKIQS